MPQRDRMPEELSVDLSNCDREPIHIIGRIQNFGALISFTSDWMANHVSENITDFLECRAVDLIGRPVADIFGADAVDSLQSRLQVIAATDTVDRIFGLQITENGPRCDVAIHVSGKNIVVELERSDPTQTDDLTAYIRPMIARMEDCATIDQLCGMAVRQIKALTGMHRVKVYRFNHDDSGTVIAEARDKRIDSLLGLTFPATDIPKQARALLMRNQLRVMHDTSDEGSAIIPNIGPSGDPLDLAMSTTRAHSPIHMEYLRNMGLGATLTISIMRNGRLWGLFACHHNVPKVPSYPLRTALELFGMLFEYRLDQTISASEKADTIRTRMLHDQVMVQLAQDRSVARNFAAIVAAIQDVIPHDGAVGWIDGQHQSTGSTPDIDQFRQLLPFLNTTAAGTVFATHSLAEQMPAAQAYASDAAGLLALPVSRTTRDFIVLFRREIARSIRWAGNPEKEYTHGEFGPRLTPRKSFDAWQETARNQCAEWTPAQIQSAEALRVTLMEVVLRMMDANLKERTQAQAKQELLIAELNHRVRNILNLIKGVISQSGAGHNDVSSFTKVVGGRIHALAMAHDQITREKWQPASLRDLIETEAAAYLDDRMDRLVVTGPDAMLKPDAYTTVALVLHEMITNSVKYGALKSDHGKVTVMMTQKPDDSLDLSWLETGGAAVTAPERRGFGTTVIERSIPFELNGTSDLRFLVSGVAADFNLPANTVDRFVAEAGTSRSPERKTDTDIPDLPGQVLIVEDNVIIGLDAEALLHRIGVTESVIVSNVADGLETLDQQRFDFVLLDINLGSETSFPVADFLLEQGIRFAFASGYGKLPDMAEKYAHIPVLVKPYDEAELRRAISR